MDPQRKGALMQYTTAAKSIIFDANRMREFLPMMDTKSGAIQAVQTVVSVIEQKKPVPPDIALRACMKALIAVFWRITSA